MICQLSVSIWSWDAFTCISNWADSFTSKHFTFFFFFLYPVIFLILLLFVLTFPTSYLVISEQNHPTLSVPLFMPIMSKTSDGNIFISRKSMLFCKEIRNNIKLVISIFKALTKAQNPHKFSIKTDFLEEII